jgi:hypothetical protein
MNSIDRLPKVLRNKVIEKINDPGLYQREIVDAINAEAGKKIISFSALNRYVKSMEKFTGKKRGKESPTVDESLGRIADALERIAFSLKKQ